MQIFLAKTWSVNYFCLLISFVVMMSTQADDMDQPADPQANEVEIISHALSTFELLKRRGTVWLRTQAWVDELERLSSVNESANSKDLARRILQDCHQIDNQLNLERARYLLATLETTPHAESDLDGIRAMLVVADGQAALRLAEAAFNTSGLRLDSD